MTEPEDVGFYEFLQATYFKQWSDLRKYANDRGIRLPETGGAGTTVLLVVGGLLCAVALLFYITKKRVSLCE